MDGRIHYFWVDAEEKAVTRRAIPGPDDTRMMVMRGGRVPRVRLYEVEPLGAGLPRDRTRTVIGQGSGSPSSEAGERN